MPKDTVSLHIFLLLRALPCSPPSKMPTRTLEPNHPMDSSNTLDTSSHGLRPFKKYDFADFTKASRKDCDINSVGDDERKT